MKEIQLYQVDAFTDHLFSGNPAAICPLDSWLDNGLMQSIANENNLAETAFIVPKGKDFEIRWFTPTVEVDLCGHATLAAAYVLFNELGYDQAEIKFYSPRSGLLTVSKKNKFLYLNFPTDELKILNMDKQILKDCIGIIPLEIWKGKTDVIAIVNNQKELLNLQTNFSKIAQLDARGLIVTSKGSDVDFVSRFFGPQSGIDEDPVTGSAHTSLIPLWSEKLGKSKLSAKQLSKRGGLLACQLMGSRCLIGGKAILYLKGQLTV